jgi:predicted ribosome quality control (RQC) complex YloA/Tae2 family protein
MSGRYKTFISSDGMEILVGNKDKDNDYLTFKVASAQDFWLHVADNSGAHVVVRNENRVKRLPKKTLGEAASLAAYYSKSRQGGQVAIHYTQRQNVRKGKGAPSGRVILKEYRIVKAKPKAEI